MSFREKSAWVQFVTLVLVFGGYYLAMHLGFIPMHGEVHLRYLMACIGGFIVLQIVLHIIIAIQNPADARSPKDERERSIQQRSHELGYYVLGVAVFAQFPLGHTYAGISNLLHWAFFSLLASSVVVSLTQIVLFRRNS